MRQLEVHCPTCAGSYGVPLDVIRDSQQMIEAGCPGTSDYECPARYYAGLLDPDTVARELEEREALPIEDVARRDTDGGAAERA